MSAGSGDQPSAGHPRGEARARPGSLRGVSASHRMGRVSSEGTVWGRPDLLGVASWGSGAWVQPLLPLPSLPGGKDPLGRLPGSRLRAGTACWAWGLSCGLALSWGLQEHRPPARLRVLWPPFSACLPGTLDAPCGGSRGRSRRARVLPGLTRVPQAPLGPALDHLCALSCPPGQQGPHHVVS